VPLPTSASLNSSGPSPVRRKRHKVRRFEPECRANASSVFPVPLSPESSTGASDRASLSTSSKILPISLHTDSSFPSRATCSVLAIMQAIVSAGGAGGLVDSRTVHSRLGTLATNRGHVLAIAAHDFPALPAGGCGLLWAKLVGHAEFMGSLAAKAC
jgi:hypothetical protein